MAGHDGSGLLGRYSNMFFFVVVVVYREAVQLGRAEGGDGRK